MEGSHEPPQGHSRRGSIHVVSDFSKRDEGGLSHDSTSPFRPRPHHASPGARRMRRKRQGGRMPHPADEGAEGALQGALRGLAGGG